MMWKSANNWRAAVAAAAVITGAVAITAAKKADAPTGSAIVEATQGKRFTLHTPDLEAKGRITAAHVFSGMGCTGQNISPYLHWINAPAGTKSFAVTAYDPDAPTGSGWWHWVVYNIPASTTELVAGAGASSGRNAPAGSVQGTTDFGTKGYGGPCPPTGDKPHHYHFTVFALKVDKIDVPANATAAMVGYNLNANKLATASVTALYGR
jgi:Raf kinase inhibitor-like YbhB/YbcL family protein